MAVNADPELPPGQQPASMRMTMPTRNRRRTLAAFTLTTLILSGCATVPPSSNTTSSVSSKPHTYAEARADADALWESYRLRAREQTAIANGLYVWLSAIAATIMGLGITGTAGVPITGLGLVGAYSYGLGTWFTKPEHLAIYKAGADAMHCVRDKSRPLGSAEENAKELDAAIKKGDLQKALDGLVAPVTALRDTIAPDGQEATKAGALDDARQAEEAARATLKNARGLMRNLNEAGDQLWTTVESVRTEVDFAIRRTTDPRDIMAHIQQNVTGAYKGLTAFGTGLAGSAAQAGATSQSRALNAKKARPKDDDFAAKLEALHQAVATVVAETKNLSALIDSSSIPGVADGISQCLTTAQGNIAVPRIAVSPTEVTLAPGKSENVLIIGATHPILRKIPSAAPFTATPSAADGNTTVTVKADDPAVAGEYVLDIKVPIGSNDTVDRTVKVTITGDSGKPGEGAKPGGSTAADINKVLSQKGWTCGEGKTWTSGSAPGGGMQASIVCDEQAAQAVINGHKTQIDALKAKNPKSTVTATAGKLQIVVPEAKDVDALIAAVNAAL
jgi:hypothetical protein